jgi:hypothetical protein
MTTEDGRDDPDVPKVVISIILEFAPVVIALPPDAVT